MSKLTVIIPAKNEEANLVELIRRLHKTLKSQGILYKAIVVDDNSTDRTSEIVKTLSQKFPVRLLKKKGKPGKAFSIIEGARLAKSEFVAMIDADLQYPPEILPELLRIAEVEGVAVGNRTKRNTSKIRQIASKSFRFLFGRVLMGMNIDVQSGIKVFRREIIKHVSEKDVTPWTLDMPLLHTARELGYSIGSVDMEFAERKGGQSKIRVLKASTEIGLKALKLKFARRKIYSIEPTTGMIGAGLAYKKKRYITHTTLDHKNSAMVTITTGQKLFVALLLSLIVYGLVSNPFLTALTFVAILSLIYFVDVLFSGFVLLKSLHFPPELKFKDEEIEALEDNDLPTYSVLCPLYKEAQILPTFVEAMDALSWPKKKLEVLLLLEENDKQTIEAAENMKLPSHFKIVVVPHSFPKTKPKACNYGLSMAKGEYVVIYDAEDIPDPLQLKKVYLAFKKLGKKYGCVQCKLNYFNPTHNVLTRLFTTEYSLWFDVILPGLQSIEGTIPLGGTSNHFRKADLVGLHAWDPFNVTEDCDLGVRLFKNGYKTAIVDSVTLEEANSRIRNWIRQRSRWIKGYFQTYLVHMRNPVSLFRAHGIHALIFQLVIGMRMTFMLINPVLWGITIAYFAAYSIVGPTIEALFPPLVFYMAAFALIVGNFMYIYNYMIGAAKRGHWDLVKYVYLIPFYWLLTSVAAIMALWQLITKPHYWEKTNHGLHLKKEKLNASDVDMILDERRRFKLLSRVHFGSITTSRNIAALFLIISSLGNNFFGFLYNAYLGRELSPEEFGVIGLLGSFLYISQVLTSGIGRTVTYKSANLFGKYGIAIKPFWLKTKIRWTKVSVLISILWLIATPLLMKVFNSTDPIPFVLFAPLWSIGILSSIDTGFLTGSLRFTVISIATLFESILKFLLAYIFVSLKKPELVYFAVPISALFLLIVCRISIAFIPDKKSKIDEVKDLRFPRKFFFTSILSKISSVAFLSLDVLLAKLFLSPRDAGLYALLSLIGKMIYFLGTLFAQFITPLVSKAEGEGRNSHKVFLKLIFATLFSSLFGFVTLGVFGNITVPFLLGDKVIPIIPFLLPYAAAMVATTIAINIVGYHQIKSHHLFPFASFAISIIQVIAIAIYHTDLNALVWMIIIVSLLHLAVIYGLHIFYDKVLSLFRNSLDFLGLFSSIPNSIASQEKGKLRILVFNWRDTKHVWAGGAEVYIQEIAKRWVEDGNQVTLFCGNDGKNKRHEIVDGVRVVRRGGFYTVYLWAVLYYLLRFRGQFDVVVDNENGVPFFTPFFVTVPKFLLIHHVHQEVFRENLTFPFSFIAMFIEKRIMPFLYSNSKVITVSESSKKDIIGLGCSKKSNVEIVSPGIDLSAYKIGRKFKKPTFIYLGRLKRYKNVNVAIKAFSFVVKKYPDAVFYIVGEGDASYDLRRLTNTLNLNRSVIFTDHVSEARKIKLMSSSWVSVQPSSFEGWGITVIEANACGTPVIASDTNGLKDSVVDGKTGLLVPVKNATVMSKAMTDLIEDVRFRKELSKNARNWAEKFDWNESAKRFYFLLKESGNKEVVIEPVSTEVIYEND